VFCPIVKCPLFPLPLKIFPQRPQTRLIGLSRRGNDAGNLTQAAAEELEKIGHMTKSAEKPAK
jgi:hypothetical protein